MIESITRDACSAGRCTSGKALRLRQINGAGTALLIVEQQVDRVLEIARTAVVLEHGSVAYSGSSDGALAAVEKVLASRGERTILTADSDPDGAR